MFPAIWRRPLCVVGPATVTGVLLAALPAPWPGAAVVATFGLALALGRGVVILVLPALCAGLLVSHLALADTARALAHAARARSPPSPQQCLVSVDRCGSDPFRGRSWLEGRREDGLGILCAWPGDIPRGLGPGARVRVAGRFYVPRAAGNPGESDARARLATRGISLCAETRTAANVELLRTARPGFAPALLRARVVAARRLMAALPEDVAPLAAALLLGLRSGVAAEDRIRFKRTGTMHMLAISGLHVVLLAGAVHGLLRLLGTGPRLAAAVTLVLVLGYTPIAGGAPPIRRAATVLALYVLALVRGRPPDSASALGGAAALLALWDPHDVFRVGFWLSFCAAAGIAWLAGSWRQRWSARHRLLARFPAVRQDRPVRLWLMGSFWRAFPVSLAAWCATQAIVAHAFGIATPWAPLINVIVAPWLGLALPMIALVALGVDAVAPLASFTLRSLRHVLDMAGSLPWAHVAVSAPLGAVLAWSLGVVLLRHQARAARVALLAGLGLAARPGALPAPGLTLLDVGHGQAALVHFADGNSVLVDAGSRNRPEPAMRIVIPALRALGVLRLEAIVCTHADADHWNAIPDVLAAVPVTRIIVGQDPPLRLLAAARRAGTAVLTAKDGMVIHASGRTRLRVLNSESCAPSDNDRALVLVLEANGRRILLPADREEAGLLALLRRGVEPCDVMVAPHHGARCDVAVAFGRAVRAHWLLVSDAPGFADAATLRGYGAARILHTADAGCLRVTVDEDGRITVDTYRRATIRAP